ncbi:hypothetical protein HAX54_008108 [Datura stramonium]|uniref:Uncharacterized protein n=1 Tax=Datura stramonium TaxID=4076 RepID=A0ABS8WV08_DATST|nr:hypothetical protein [Datura stramonium]
MASHVTLAREHAGVAQALGQISERLTAIEQHQREAREMNLGDGLLPAPDARRRANRHREEEQPPKGRANRQPARSENKGAATGGFRTNAIVNPSRSLNPVKDGDPR